jgi:hypothetical protein
MEKYPGLETFRHLKSPDLAIKAGLYSVHSGGEWWDIKGGQLDENSNDVARLFKCALTVRNNVGYTLSEVKQPGRIRQYGDGSLEGHGYECSPVDVYPKKSEYYINCIGIVATGLGDGENVSLLIHAFPPAITSKDSYFSSDLLKLFNVLREKSESQTIDCVIFGGALREGDEEGQYDRSIQIINDVAIESFGFTPTVITPPKNDRESERSLLERQGKRLYAVRTDALLDTANRRLYIWQSDEFDQTVSYKDK